MRTILIPILLLAGALPAQQVTLTQTGPWTAPAGVDTITVELIGPGGNGGTNGGGGGGGGGYVRRTVAVQPGSAISFVVGTGGSGLGTIAGGLGLIAEAGANGTTVPNPGIGGGGAGGAGIGGTVNRSGGPGGGGYWTYFGGGGGGAAGAQGNGGPGGNTIAWNGNCLTPGGAGGSGGGAPAGAGGRGAGFTDANCTVTEPEGHGGAFGGGGGGGNGIGSPGGTGGDGVVIITWNTSTALVERDAWAGLRAVVSEGRVELRNAPAGAWCTLVDARGAVRCSGSADALARCTDLPPGVWAVHVRTGTQERVLKVVVPAL